MNKYIKQLLAFLVVLFVAIYALEYSIDTVYKNRVTNKFSKLLTHQVDAEIMIYGSSVVYHQFDPGVIDSITHLSAYNMGWPGMFFSQYIGLIDEYLTYGKKCKYLVIGCDFDNLGKNELITRPDLFLAWLNNPNIYRSLYEIEQRKIFLAKYLPGYKLTLLKKAFYVDMVLGAKMKDTHSGFEALNNPWEQSSHTTPFRARYNDKVYAEFKTKIAEINQKGIKVILVIPPVYKEGYKLINNTELIKSKYKALISDNVHFLDYTNDTLCYTQSYFRNFTHLNGVGAGLFSRTFANDLLKIIHE